MTNSQNEPASADSNITATFAASPSAAPASTEDPPMTQHEWDELPEAEQRRLIEENQAQIEENDAYIEALRRRIDERQAQLEDLEREVDEAWAAFRRNMGQILYCMVESALVAMGALRLED